MQQAPSEGWAFPDDDSWAVLADAATAPARHVEFFCEGDSDPGLMPFRIGINAAGDPLSLGDSALAKWVARIASILDRLATGELVAVEPDGVQVPSAQWRGPVTIVRETMRPWDKIPRPRIERYHIVRDRERLHVSLGPEPFAAPGRVVLSVWIELADGKRLPPLCLKKPPLSIAEDRGIAAGTPAGSDAPVIKRGHVKREAVRLLEVYAQQLVKTNGLLVAASAIHGMMKMEKSVSIDTVRSYIADRYWELSAERKIAPSPTSPRSKAAR
jgi:hypothetical protein